MRSTTPRLKPSVEAFPASTGDLYLLRTDGEGDIVLRDATPFAHALVGALAEGGRTEGELSRDLAAEEREVRTAVGELDAAGVLTYDSPATAGFDGVRYDRQLHYFADQASPGHEGRDMQLALARATVVVLGAGGLGSWTMAALTCAGVGRIVAADHDTVELSNLNRQILYRTPDVGRLKVEVAGEALRSLNPDTEFVALPRRVDGPDDVRSVARDADFVVCTADSPVHEIGRWVNEACLDLGIPHVSAGQFPPRVRIGPTFVPGRPGCLACQERQFRRGFALYDELVAHRRASSPVAATLGAPSGLIGSLLAMEVIHWITGICEPATLGRGLVFDLRDFSTQWEPVEPDPDCELRCGSAERREQRLLPFEREQQQVDHPERVGVGAERRLEGGVADD
jgi:molybdopterin-synthase adenylyltransferase